LALHRGARRMDRNRHHLPAVRAG